MEEKERFELFGEHCIKDNNPDARPQLLDAYVACVILNEQDKRIKELEEELDDAKRDYIPKLEFGLQRANKMGIDAEKENQQLKQQLAKLKQKAIVPKFVLGQEIWDKYLMAWKIKRVETHQFDKGNGNTAIIEIYRLGHYGNDDYNCCILPCDNDIFFATKEEAQAKLKELGEKRW